MEEIILNAIARQKTSARFRELGFVPGVLYGDNIPAGSNVKFDEKALRTIINKHGSNANITVVFNDKKNVGFIKEIQRKPITGALVHVDIQVVSKEHEIKRQIPIVFNGEDILMSKNLQLNIAKSELLVFGKIALMPDTLFVDVSEMEIKDSITCANFVLDKSLKIEEPDVIYAVVSEQKINYVEEPDAEVATETEETETAATAE